MAAFVDSLATMADTLTPHPQVPAGMPVEIGKIDRELKKLWDQSDGAMTRASLINLAVYSEAPGSLPSNTAAIAEITQDHACRAIVIGAEPDASEPGVEAWISAHCHVTGTGSKQVCSEQLSFLLKGASENLLRSIVFSHLDSDLPLYLWWQGEFPASMDPQLWAWVDRLIYDSQIWHDVPAQIGRIETAQSEAKQRVVLCDLNWTRLVHVRLALAQFFDHPRSHRHLGEIESVEIDHAPQFRSTAVLLAGWLAAQLGWKAENSRSGEVAFIDPAGKRVAFVLAEKTGEAIGRCRVACKTIALEVAHAPKADLLDVSVNAGGKERMRQLMPAGRDTAVQLMDEELMRGGPHRVYLRALNCVRDLL